MELPWGIPSHDTFRTVLSALDSKQLAQALRDWTENVREKLGRSEIVAINGKNARRSVAKGVKAALQVFGQRVVSKPSRRSVAKGVKAALHLTRIFHGRSKKRAKSRR